MPSKTHGETSSANHNGKHRHSPEYRIWASMLQRCRNPRLNNYKYYGAQGVKVCARWSKSFVHFLADVGRRPSPAHSLDRHPNPKGNYEPGNVRWATPEQQVNNRRTTKLIEHNGLRLSAAAWSRRLGMEVSTVRRRINKGWPIALAVTATKRSVVYCA